ncbi:MAG: hypothetical protein LC777_17870, partial [Actinobacteria bacterium]|nr:hypothetical protein [Actinomycetota bacterium]
MILLLRALVRLLGFLLLIALALVGLGFALAALLGDQLGVQLEGSAVSRWLERLEGNGTQVLEAVIGGGMVLLGLLLLIGALAPRRERRAVLEQGEHGTLD